MTIKIGHKHKHKHGSKEAEIELQLKKGESIPDPGLPPSREAEPTRQMESVVQRLTRFTEAGFENEKPVVVFRAGRRQAGPIG
jgi:hypothetical protein